MRESEFRLDAIELWPPCLPEPGEHDCWQIMLPGGVVGMIVGYATQRYGQRRGVAHA